MKRIVLSALLASALFATGCGEAPGGGEGGDVGFELYVSRAVIEEVGAFQLSLRKKGSGSNACTGLTQGCLRDQLDSLNELVSFTNSEGRDARAMRVSVSLTTEGEFQTQDVVMRDVPVGRDYGLVVEALSKSDPPQLLAISCRPNVEVRRENTLILAQPLDLPEGGPVACDPRID